MLASFGLYSTSRLGGSPDPPLQAVQISWCISHQALRQDHRGRPHASFSSELPWGGARWASITHKCAHLLDAFEGSSTGSSLISGQLFFEPHSLPYPIISHSCLRLSRPSCSSYPNHYGHWRALAPSSKLACLQLSARSRWRGWICHRCRGPQTPSQISRLVGQLSPRCCPRTAW